jgi:hypothetical protein
MIYKPKYFQLYELLPRDFYEENKHLGDRLWLIFDQRMLWTLDQIREHYGKIIVNDWYWGGDNEYGGWRPFDCEVGAALSQHKFGRAADPKPQECTAEEIRQDVKNASSISHIFKYITCIEEGVPWFHFDVRNWDKKNGILIIHP